MSGGVRKLLWWERVMIHLERSLPERRLMRDFFSNTFLSGKKPVTVMTVRNTRRVQFVFLFHSCFLFVFSFLFLVCCFFKVSLVFNVLNLGENITSWFVCCLELRWKYNKFCCFELRRKYNIWPKWIFYVLLYVKVLCQCLFCVSASFWSDTHTEIILVGYILTIDILMQRTR